VNIRNHFIEWGGKRGKCCRNNRKPIGRGAREDYDQGPRGIWSLWVAVHQLEIENNNGWGEEKLRRIKEERGKTQKFVLKKKSVGKGCSHSSNFHKIVVGHMHEFAGP